MSISSLVFYCGSLIAALVRAKVLPWYVRANCDSGPLSAHIEVRFVASADITRERGESCRTREYIGSKK
jgi:hypothetical protein